MKCVAFWIVLWSADPSLCEKRLFEDDACAMSLLQVRARSPSHESTLDLQAPDWPLAHLDTPEARRQAAYPLAWLHVPKTGSSLASTLITLPGACSLLPADFDFADFASHHPRGMLHHFSKQYWPDSCPGLAGITKAFGDASAVAEGFATDYEGKGVMMLRSPRERQISAWRWHTFGRDDYDGDVSKFARSTAGCATRMLTQGVAPGDSRGDDWRRAGCWGTPPPLSEADGQLAKQRLTQLAFVGLTEEWSLSVCLLHALFGGECSTAELENSRPTGNSDVSEDEASDAYGGFVDALDNDLYETGRRIFHERLRDFGITRESCAASCGV